MQSNLSSKGKIPLANFLRLYKYDLLSFSRPDLRLLSNLLSGHSDLNYFKHIQNRSHSPKCAHCPNSQETTEHFLCKCPAYSYLRLTFFNTHLTSINFLTTKFKPSVIISFVKATNRFTTYWCSQVHLTPLRFSLRGLGIRFGLCRQQPMGQPTKP